MEKKSATTYPPGPKSRLLPHGQLLALRRTPDNFLRLARRYGDIVYFKIGPQRFFLLNHPDHVQDVLVTHHYNFLRGWGPQRGHSLLGEGLLTSEGRRHHRHRRLIQPAFHKQRLSAYAEMMVQHGAQLSESWQDGQTLDIEYEMRLLTLVIACKALFNAEIEAEAEAVFEALTVFVRHFGVLMLPYVGRLKRLSRRKKDHRLQQAQERLERIIQQIIAERRRHQGDRGDLLSMLLLMRDEESNGERLTEDELRDEVMTLFITAHESTTSALSLIWYLLSQHPEVEARLHEELDTILIDRSPTVEDYPCLHYTRMVVMEAIRLYPPQWMIGRRAINDYEVDGYRVPAGSFVLMSPYVMHHHPRYFPDPFRFDPERWTAEARKSRPPYSFFPFGGGPRRCIGEGFAWMEATLLVATLARHWRLRLAPGQQLEIEPFLVLRPKNGIRMSLERRK